jgi:hypothetical protein
MIFALSILLAVSSTHSAPPAEQLVRQIEQAYKDVEAENAKLPPATTVAEKLIRLGKLDQAGRMAYMKFDLSAFPESSRASVRHQIFAEIGRHDLQFQNELKALLPAEGWFRTSVYGKEAARAAFLIVQHAVNDQELMRNTLVRLEKLVAEGEAEGQAYAMLYDRIALEFDHRPQRYGTQVKCISGQWQPNDLEDPASVNERRKSIGMNQTVEQYLEMFDNSQCAEPD